MIPLPVPDLDTLPFWEACSRHELVLQRCGDCGTWRFPPRPRCPSCRSAAAEWAPVSGRGTLASWTLCHPPVLPGFADRVPYNAIVVQLDEGPFLVSNLVAHEDDDLRCDLPVEVVFTDVADGVALPHFRPRR